MPLGTAGGGYGGSADTQRSGSYDSGGAAPNASGQNFADQGQGAMNEDMMGSDQDDGRSTNDIEIERSQGNESDVEGSSL
jgi:hypothetical protein